MRDLRSLLLLPALLLVGAAPTAAQSTPPAQELCLRVAGVADGTDPDAYEAAIASGAVQVVEVFACPDVPDPTPEPSQAPLATLHGYDLAIDELSHAGSLGLTTKQFRSRWNAARDLDGEELGTLPKAVTNTNGVRYLSLTKGPVEVLIILGEGDDIRSVGYTFAPADRPTNDLRASMRDLRAMLMLGSLADIVAPDATDDERNNLFAPLGWPGVDEPWGEREAQATIGGVTFTLVAYDDDGTTKVWMTARHADA